MHAVGRIRLDRPSVPDTVPEHWGRGLVLRPIAAAAIAVLGFLWAQSRAEAEPDDAPPARADAARYIIRYDHWTEADERGYGEFIAAIGHSGCRTVDRCLHDPANPFRASDPEGIVFRADCADLPYYLRFYYAWKHSLPF